MVEKDRHKIEYIMTKSSLNLTFSDAQKTRIKSNIVVAKKIGANAGVIVSHTVWLSAACAVTRR